MNQNDQSGVDELIKFFAQQKVNRIQRNQTKEEIQLYDRHNFIGNHSQDRLINSQVLIVGLGGCNSELGKNLVLSGANVTIIDEALINDEDIDTNFFFGKADLGKDRGQLGVQKLKEINPLAKVFQAPNINITNLHREIIINKRQIDFDVVDVISTTTQSFEEMRLWDEISQCYNIPYYNLVCCGLYGFIYISLGKEFSYERETPIIRKFVMGQKNDEQLYKYFEQVTAQTYSIDKTLKEDYRITNHGGNDIYYCILMMSKTQKDEDLKNFDPFDPSVQNQSKLDKIVQIGTEIYKQAMGTNPKDSTLDLLRNFARLYGVDFCPTYSVLGSVASQELIIVISRINEPAINWFTYDSQAGCGFNEIIQDKTEFKRQPLPERTKKVVNQ